jgi:hypothetical protein
MESSLSGCPKLCLRAPSLLVPYAGANKPPVILEAGAQTIGQLAPAFFVYYGRGFGTRLPQSGLGVLDYQQMPMPVSPPLNSSSTVDLLSPISFDNFRCQRQLHPWLLHLCDSPSS